MTLQIQDMTVLRASAPLQVKFAGSHLAEGEIEGYASTFGGEPDSYGDIIAPGAFTASLIAHKAAGTVPVMLWSHDVKAPIGRWVELRQDDRGLYVKGQLNLETDRGRDAHAHLKAGDVAPSRSAIVWPMAGNSSTRTALQR
jgi:phage head maturation protease